MNIAVQKMTDWLLHVGSIEKHQREWCVYTLEKCLSTFVSLVLLIGIGCLVAPFGIVILLNLGMVYLRPRVNGFHAKTFGGCLILSVVLELIALLLTPLLNEPVTWITFGCPFLIILIMGSFNNQKVHYSEQEMVIMRKRMVVHLSVFCLVTAVFLLTFPDFAKSMVMTLNMVAFLLLLAKIGFGIQ